MTGRFSVMNHQGKNKKQNKQNGVRPIRLYPKGSGKKEWDADTDYRETNVTLLSMKTWLTNLQNDRLTNLLHKRR